MEGERFYQATQYTGPSDVHRQRTTNTNKETK
jgi:hypothetical protein